MRASHIGTFCFVRQFWVPKVNKYWPAFLHELSFRWASPAPIDWWPLLFVVFNYLLFLNVEIQIKKKTSWTFWDSIVLRGLDWLGKKDPIFVNIFCWVNLNLLKTGTNVFRWLNREFLKFHATCKKAVQYDYCAEV